MDKEKVIAVVCEICEVSLHDLHKRSKKEPLPTARALIAHFLYEDLNIPPREILSIIGHPHCSRTTIYHYIRHGSLVKVRHPYQKEIRDKMEQVQKKLNELKNEKK